MAILPTIHSPADLRALPVERLPELAREIREAICAQISRSGGHLAPNLGVVELTIALHYVFDFAHDRLLFDVGHQCYPHKLLTGRLALLDGLRTRRGMSGFPEPSESPFDLFRVGHAGTGISTAVGMARGDTLAGEAFDASKNKAGRRVVTLIGDASIVNGVAMEGLNNAGTLNRQFLVVLNDNGMSISHPQGALAQYFDRVRLSNLYSGLKKSARGILKHVPGGSLVEEAYHRAGEATKAMLNEGGWFEHFGLVTVGPIDGHELPTLIDFLSEARDFDRPMVLHVKTIKGKGFGFAEGESSKFHSPPAFNVQGQFDDEGCRVELKSEGRSFTAALGEAMADLMRRDSKVVTCTAAMPDGTGLGKVLAEFPERAWDTGICESHALDMMAGLARTGFKPFFAVYSTFFQRAFDQAFQEAALQGLPVRLCLDRAGLVGGDGAVHHGFCDIALLRTLPGAVITAAIDEPSLRAALEFMLARDEGISAVRYPRDTVTERFLADPCPPFEIGRARHLCGPDPRADHGAPGSRPDADAAILVFGALAAQAIDASDLLSRDYRTAVYDARFAKPVDTDLLVRLAGANIPVVTLEDHSVIGGFGAAVIEAYQELGVSPPPIARLGLPDAFIAQDSRASQLAEVGLDAAGIARAVRALCERASAQATTSARQAASASPVPAATRSVTL